MMHSGTAYPLQPSAHPTAGTGSSSWLTPATLQISSRSEESHKRREGHRVKTGRTTIGPGSLNEQVVWSEREGKQVKTIPIKKRATWATPSTMDTRSDVRKPGEKSARAKRGGCANLREQVMYPTARTRGLLGGSGSREMARDMVKRGELTEEEAAQMMGVRMWPTPREAISRGNPTRDMGKGNLEDAVAKKMWPTVRASEYKGVGPKGSKSQKHALKKGYLMGKVSEISEEGEQSGIKTQRRKTQQLNPLWVEWLMGFPIGWTDLSASETQSFRRSPSTLASESGSFIKGE